MTSRLDISYMQNAIRKKKADNKKANNKKATNSLNCIHNILNTTVECACTTNIHFAADVDCFSKSLIL